MLGEVAVELASSEQRLIRPAVSGSQELGVTDIGGIIVALVTLGLGFIPFIVLSLMTNSFWPQSSVAVPLTLVPSVLIGDSIVLPIFNGLLYRLLRKAFRTPVTRATKWVLVLYGVLCIAASAGVMIRLHLLWVSDKYTGFIDLMPGQLSTAGIWHVAFSTIQMAIALWFVGVSFWWIREADRLPRIDVLRVWAVFLVYASLSIADFVFNRMFILSTPATMNLADFLALAPSLLALLAFESLRRLSIKQVRIN
jgi:hypothetical protein